MQSFSKALPPPTGEEPGSCPAAVSNGAFALQWGPDPSCGVHSGGDRNLVSAYLVCELYWLCCWKRGIKI